MDRTAALASPRRSGRLGLVLAALAVLVLLVAACGGTASTPAPTAPPTPSDAYSVISRAVAAPMDKVKIDLGIKTTGTGSDMTIDPKSIELVIDTKAGKGTFHLSLPKSALGSDASALPITGDTIDLDVLFDGQAVYAKSPIAAQFLPMLLMQSGQQVNGDLSGWLKLGTVDDFKGLVGSLGAMASMEPGASEQPSMPSLASLSPDELKQQLEAAGVTFTYVGREQRNGVDADHVQVSIDPSKLEGSDAAKQLPLGQLGGLSQLAGKGTLTGDIWFNAATGQLSEADINVADSSGGTTAVTLLVSDAGDVSIDTPANATDVPLTSLLQTLMSTFGGLMPGASANP
jgi:hypothetical protein